MVSLFRSTGHAISLAVLTQLTRALPGCPATSPGYRAPDSRGNYTMRTPCTTCQVLNRMIPPKAEYPWHHTWNNDCIVAYIRAKKRIDHHRGTPSLLVCRLTSRSQSKKKLWCKPFPWESNYGVHHFHVKTREHCIHHRSLLSGIHIEASDPERRGV